MIYLCNRFLRCYMHFNFFEFKSNALFLTSI